MAYPYDPRQQNPGYNPPAWANPQQQQWTNPQPNPTPPPQSQFYNAPLIPQPRTVPCRVVNNPADITPSEIPMDGRVSLFLSSDNSYIIAKQWNQNGLIDTAIYRPEIQNQQTDEEAVPFKQEVLNRLGRIESFFETLTDPTTTETAPSKEVKPK